MRQETAHPSLSHYEDQHARSRCRAQGIHQALVYIEQWYTHNADLMTSVLPSCGLIDATPREDRDSLLQLHHKASLKRLLDTLMAV